MKGQIIERGPNRFLIRVYLGTINGKRRYKARTIHGRRRTAERELRKWLTEIEAGGYVVPANMTVGQLLDRWLRDWAADNVGPTTRARYESIVRVHLKPEFEHTPIARLHPLMVNDLYAKKREAGLSSATIRLIHVVLHSAMAAAVRWRLISANPVDGTDRPRLERRQATAYTRDQAQQLLDALDGQLHVVGLLGLTLGPRIGEIRALQWDEDMDLDASMIRVQHTLAWTKEEGLFLKLPKTKKSARMLEAGPALVRVLRTHKVAQAKARLAAGGQWDPRGFVICGQNGQPLHPQSVSRSIKRVAARLGLPPLTAHVLRHTAASLMLANNTHPKAVQEIFGHETISTTLDLYSHMTPGLALRAAEGVETTLLG